MGRLKKYANDAERQAAKRARDKAQWVQVSRDGHNAHNERLERLQTALSDAAKRGDETAKACRAASADTMLEKLAAWFESVAIEKDATK